MLKNHFRALPAQKQAACYDYGKIIEPVLLSFDIDKRELGQYHLFYDLSKN